MSSDVPKIEHDWRPVRVHISVPTADTAWVTDVEFQTPCGVRVIRFTKSDRYLDIGTLLTGYDEIRITGQNKLISRYREFGRYVVEFIVDGDSSHFEVDNVEDVTYR